LCDYYKLMYASRHTLAMTRRMYGVHPMARFSVPNPLIIEAMSNGRTVAMTIRMTQHEAALRDALAEHLGIDGSGVMRQGMLELAREKGIVLQPEKPPAKAGGRSKP
jgi:hypothetical protein